MAWLAHILDHHFHHELRRRKEMNRTQQHLLAHYLNTALHQLDDNQPVGEVFDKLVAKMAGLCCRDNNVHYTWFLDQVYFGKEQHVQPQ